MFQVGDGMYVFVLFVKRNFTQVIKNLFARTLSCAPLVGFLRSHPPRENPSRESRESRLTAVRNRLPLNAGNIGADRFAADRRAQQQNDMNLTITSKANKLKPEIIFSQLLNQ